MYPTDIKSNINLYTGIYVGWKKECEGKEFIQFRNSDTSKEISEIINITEEYNSQFMIYSIMVTALYVVGILSIKYSRILGPHKKIEINKKELTNKNYKNFYTQN